LTFKGEKIGFSALALLVGSFVAAPVEVLLADEELSLFGW
jgi:hypothetical protein